MIKTIIINGLHLFARPCNGIGPSHLHGKSVFIPAVHKHDAQTLGIFDISRDLHKRGPLKSLFVQACFLKLTTPGKTGLPSPSRMRAPHTDIAVPGISRRCAALAYDALLLAALWFAVSALLLALSGGRLAEPGRPMWLIYSLRATLVLVTGLFFGGFWTHGGQTLGMRAWRLRLVSSADGGPVSWKQALLRLTGACLSAAALGIGFFWSLVDRERRSWHDRLSGTHLVVGRPVNEAPFTTAEVPKTQGQFSGPAKNS